VASAGHLLTVSEASRLILETASPAPVESIPLEQAAGRILREDVNADRDLPPFDRVTMDGVAIRFRAWQQGQRAFGIAFTQAAGAPPRSLDDPSACARVMTGAVLPVGADCVIPKEEIAVSGDTVRIGDSTTLVHRQFVHARGSDARGGDVVLRAGTRLKSSDVLIAAAVGGCELRVSRRPRVGIVSTGDELVSVDRRPAPHQIRNANAHALAAAAMAAGAASCRAVHLHDDPRELLRELAALLDEADLLLLSGGISAGEFDYLPGVLGDLGVKKLFQGIRQRPGKPLWFGLAPDARPVFALPGNPVSTLVCFHRYVRPWMLARLAAEPEAPVHAALAEPVDFAPPLTCFLQVGTTGCERGVRHVRPHPHHGSGDYASLAGTDGFVELPEEVTAFPIGYVARYYPWT